MKESSFRRWVLLLAFALLAFGMNSCGLGRLGTGVVLWSDSEHLTNGSLVWVWDQSRIRKSMIVQRTDGGSRFEISSWRVREFSNEADARAFQKQFVQWNDIWANVQRGGLFVRSEPDASASRVYRLSDGEEIKILNQNPQTVTIDGLVGHWDEVLTQNGATGWVFDYYLSLYKVANGVQTQLKQSGPGNFYLQAVETNPWYPEDFLNQVAQRRINLKIFDPGYVFHYNGSDAFDLTLPPNLSTGAPAQSFHFAFTRVQKIDTATFLFVGPANLSVRVLNPEATRIEIKFLQNDQQVTFLYARLDKNIGDYIAQETASRLDQLNTLLNLGKTLVSPTWGRIDLNQDGSFIWTGFQALQPPLGVLFPSDLTGKGQLLFDWFKDQQFVGDWQVLRMSLARSGGEPDFSQLFLYRFLKGGLQLLPVSNADVNTVKRTVLRESHLGYTLFLSFQS
jgi:hypothetical protein